MKKFLLLPPLLVAMIIVVSMVTFAVAIESNQVVSLRPVDDAAQIANTLITSTGTIESPAMAHDAREVVKDTIEDALIANDTRQQSASCEIIAAVTTLRDAPLIFPSVGMNDVNDNDQIAVAGNSSGHQPS